MKRSNLWLFVMMFALSACGTSPPLSGSGESAPSSERGSDSQPEELEPLPQVAPAKGLTAELIWRRNQRWMTKSAFLAGVHPFSDGSVLMAGQNTGTLTLGEDDNATKITGRDFGQYGRQPWLARYDQDGELIWATPIAGNSISSFVITPDDSIIVTGVIAAHEAAGNDFDVSRVFGAGTPRETRVAGCEPAFEIFQREEPQREWLPTNHSWDVGGEPTCAIRFVARFDSDGNFQWVRTTLSQYRGDAPIPAVLPDGSVVVRFTFAGVSLLDAGTPSQRDLQLPLRRLDQNVPFLVHYEPDGAISSVEQLSSPGQRLAVHPFPMDDGLVGLVGWRGMYIGTTDRDEYKAFPPTFTLSALDEDHNPLWDLEIEIPPESFAGARPIESVDHFPNGDLLITFAHRFRGNTRLSQNGEDLYETSFNPTADQSQSAKIQYALRVDQRGNIRWLIPTVQAQIERGLSGLPEVLVMDDGSWLLYGKARDSDKDYVVAPGQSNEQLIADRDDHFIARFRPDGRLDTLVDSLELSHWFPSSPIRLPDRSVISAIEDWEINPDVPTLVISRIRLELMYKEDE